MHIYVRKYHMKLVALYFQSLLPGSLHHQFAKQSAETFLYDTIPLEVSYHSSR
uniref:Meiotic checkpoint regulator cut4, putative n=1 Tax=Arundo donax TaxID=35708 RepID=A0A0A9D3S9_ARUDO